MSFAFQIEGVESIVSRWANEVSAMPAALSTAVMDAAEAGAGQARSDAPRKTGALQESIKAVAGAVLGGGKSRDSRGRFTTSGPSAEASIVVSAPHARFIVDGTDPHEIRPRNKKALRFEVGGEEVFAARVQHPGTRPNDFLAGARAVARARLDGRVGGVVHAVCQRMSSK